MPTHPSVTMRTAPTLSGSLVINFGPETPAKREILRPVDPDEPDTEVEVGYSRNRQEPLTIAFRNRKTELTLSTHQLFTYVNDINRTEGQAEFEFAELSDVLSGSYCGKSKTAIETLIRRINIALEEIQAPIWLKYNREVLYVVKR